MERLAQLLRYFTILLTLFLGMAFLWLVWPTRYRYDRLKSEASEIPVRIDRFTGRAEGLGRSGWFSLGSSESKEPSQKEKEEKDEELPPSELARLDGECYIAFETLLECSIYNGSSWKVSEITVSVEVRSRIGGAVLHSHSYRLSGTTAPLTGSSFGNANLGFSITAPQSWSFTVVGARGIRGAVPAAPR